MKKLSLKLLVFILFPLFISCDDEIDPKLLPVVSTAKISSISYFSAQSGGNITADGGYDVVTRGVCWSTSPNPTIENSKTVDAAGTGEYVSVVDSLLPNTTYYLRAYAINKKGISYGLQETFTTIALTLSELTTIPVSEITSSSAITGGIITNDGGAPITARGVCYSTTPNPTIQDSITEDGTGIGDYTSLLSDLKPGTLYYVKSYAENSEGVSYGNEFEFITQITIPEVITSAVSSITSSSAITGGEVVSDGGATVTSRGVCWHTSPSPTLKNNKTIEGEGTGSFSSSLIQLKSATTYYVRSYATNQEGTAYGEEQIFTTEIGLPELITSSASAISTNSATSGGIISYDGGADITARGICWSTLPNPTLGDNILNSGTGSGSYNCSMTGLESDTKYYVRAFATNSQGTSYGNEVSFATYGEVYNPATGKVWMDRNLGANRVATSRTDAESYGDLYQWGRDADGHEKRNSQTTSSLSSSDTSNHDRFITIHSGNYDWRNPQNNNLWQGVNGTNNPCPEGFRIPTIAEWEAERVSWNSNNSAGAIASPLKLPLAGYRSYSNAMLYSVGSFGLYWSSTVVGTHTQGLGFDNFNADNFNYYRGYGSSVRCLKD